MKKMKGKGDRFIFLVFLAIMLTGWKINLSPFPAHAEDKTPAIIIPYDTITSPGIEVWPQAKVIAKRFQIVERPAAGERIEFTEGDRHLGLALTGGDGIGVVRYTPLSEGMHKIRVRLSPASAYSAEEGELLIGVWNLARQLLLVSVDALREKQKEIKFPFIGRIKKDGERRPMEGAVDILSALSKRFHIVYLYRGDLAQVSGIRSWLSQNQFPVSPILIWDNGTTSLNKVLADREKNIKGAIVTAGDATEPLQKEGIRTLLLVEKKRQSEYKGKLKETTLVTDWKEIKKNID